MSKQQTNNIFNSNPSPGFPGSQASDKGSSKFVESLSSSPDQSQSKSDQDGPVNQESSISDKNTNTSQFDLVGDQTVSAISNTLTTPKESDEIDAPGGLPNVKKYFCTTCNKGFTRKHNMVSHELIHSQVKPHMCSVCRHTFRRIHDLKRHEKLHTGERPYQCLHCSRSFARPDSLIRHQNSSGACVGTGKPVHTDTVTSAEQPTVNLQRYPTQSQDRSLTNPCTDSPSLRPELPPIRNLTHHYDRGRLPHDAFRQNYPYFEARPGAVTKHRDQGTGGYTTTTTITTVHHGGNKAAHEREHQRALDAYNDDYRENQDSSVGSDRNGYLPGLGVKLDAMYQQAQQAQPQSQPQSHPQANQPNPQVHQYQQAQTQPKNLAPHQLPPLAPSNQSTSLPPFLEIKPNLFPQLQHNTIESASNSPDDMNGTVPNPVSRDSNSNEPSDGHYEYPPKPDALTARNLNIANQYNSNPEENNQALGARSFYYNQMRNSSLYQYPNEEYISLSRYQDLVTYAQSLEESLNKISSRIQLLEDESEDKKISRERAKQIRTTHPHKRKKHKSKDGTKKPKTAAEH